MKVTLKDIADDTGLSISTVSRALSRKGKISPKNEKIIFESAHRLNYPLNNIETPIDLRDNVYIALIINSHPGEFYASLYDGLDAASKNTNYNFCLFNIAYKQKSAVDFITSIHQDQFDAAVVFLPSLSQDDYKTLLTKIGESIPMVSAAPLPNPVMDTVSFDNYRGGYLVGKHFHEKGYQDIGIIQGPSSKIEAQLRKNGLTDYCERNNLNVMWNFQTNYDPSGGQEAFEHFKSARKKPEAIFASNDALGVGFMQRAAREGFSIPKDVAVASYDDLPICTYHHPTITSVHTDFTSLGKNIIEMLSERLKNRNSAPHTGYTKLVPVSLKVRESS